MEDKCKIAELENDLHSSNLVREEQARVIRDLLKTAGAPSLLHVSDILKMMVKFYVEEILGDNLTDASRVGTDFLEVFTGMKNEIADLKTKLRSVNNKGEPNDKKI